MSEVPQVQSAYIVAATFGSGETGRLYATAVIAANEVSAVAMCVAAFCQDNKLDAPIAGINVQRLEPDFMRAALSGGKPGEVVALHTVGGEGLDRVPANPFGAPAEPPPGAA